VYNKKTQKMKNGKFEISSAQSRIEWVGRKVTGSHNGTIAIKKGELIVAGGKLVGGKLIVDTTSIKILDITDPATNAQFAGHLASDDFFSTREFPEATLEILSVMGNHIVGNLTIKDITNTIGFHAEVDVTGDLVKATAKLVVDRTKYQMKFRSGNFFLNLGDTLIYNDFELNVNVTAKAVVKIETVPA
jgi:polyisoprenoid-binding protein YceI